MRPKPEPIPVTNDGKNTVALSGTQSVVPSETSEQPATGRIFHHISLTDGEKAAAAHALSRWIADYEQIGAQLAPCRVTIEDFFSAASKLGVDVKVPA